VICNSPLPRLSLKDRRFFIVSGDENGAIIGYKEDRSNHYLESWTEKNKGKVLKCNLGFERIIREAFGLLY